jgi:hypothetical protein
VAGSEQEPKTLIGQLRQDLGAIDMNITMLSNALDGKNGSAIDHDYRPTTRIWMAELNGMRNHTKYMLGEMTFEEMMEDANQRTKDRYVDGLGTPFIASRSVEDNRIRVVDMNRIDQEGIGY